MFHPPATSNVRTVENFGNHNKGVIGDNNSIGSIHNTETEGPVVASGGVFYAYIHSRKDDNVWRMVIMFSSRTVADEWWRAVSTSTTPQLQGNIQRITPQFYNHDPSQWNFYHFFTDVKVKAISDKFRGKMFIVLENDKGGRGITVIPLQCIVDHTSGSSFCIRSSSEPQKYWDVDEDGHVYVSDTSRTSFVVTGGDLSKKTIMVGSDTITLSTSRGAVVVVMSDPNHLVKTSTRGQGYPFRLKDLEEGRFFVGGENSFVYFSDKTKAGNAWELAM